MRITAISDTHGLHDKLMLPPGDVLIHAGDISMKGTEPEILPFMKWFGQQNFNHKIFIAGNHDFYFEKMPEEEINKIIAADVIYLNDSGTEIDGITFWGSPITPWFFNWAFNRHRGEAIKRHWDLIPDNTDVLITHGPVYKILDKTTNGTYTGCEDLLLKVQEIKSKVHICGHIHEAYGSIEKDGTLFINASVLDEKYRLKNEPVIFDI
ncbi:MAG TPA: metallophosphatase domain-containing protein [Ferruginibacter sp.]|nr:metallophosphatase domain-containing protein [Ferruginibacter sp.]